MKVALGADHAGFPLKAYVARRTRIASDTRCWTAGPTARNPSTSPTSREATCAPVLDGRADRAVLVCGSGAGAIMAANKIAGIRCALAHEPYSAHQAVEHDDANAIAMGAWLVPRALVEEILDRFLVRAVRRRRGHHPAGGETARARTAQR